MNNLPPLNRRARIFVQAHIVLALTLVLVLALTTSGCSIVDNVFGTNFSGVSAIESASAPQNTLAKEYRIGPADVLSISIWHQETMNRTVTVRPDGNISFPLLHELRATGQTPAQLEQQLTAGLKEYMNILPGELTVTVDEVHSYTVSVLGEVRTPGRFEFKSDFTVLDALAQAGGFTEFASPRRIVILRPQTNGTTRRIGFDYNKLVASNQGVQPEVFPGDTIYVP